MKNVVSVAGLLLVLIIGGLFAYYFMYIIPYSVNIEKYNEQIAAYNESVQSCVQDHNVRFVCDPVDPACDVTAQGEVAGCQILPKPQKPTLPLADKLTNWLGPLFSFQKISLPTMTGTKYTPE